MTLTQVWGALLILLVCPILGGLPLISWITYAITGRQLAKLGTGNISVSAAFYHGGKLSGILAVLSEASKGIAAVYIARVFFPTDPTWELIALIALVMGRYWIGKGAGTTNAVWGILIHDPISAGLIFLIGGISFTIFRERASFKLVILVLLVVILAIRHPQEPERIVAAMALSSVLAWILAKIPDDLDLPAEGAKGDSQKVFRFFRGDKTIISLNSALDASKVGFKAANLSKLKNWGYSVPDGWVLLAGDDREPYIKYLSPSLSQPLVVRSSAVGEDSESVSAAGQYATILNITNSEELEAAIVDCQASYNNPTAAQYRQDRQQEDASIAVIIQKQIRGVFSGVVFSRDPIDRLSSAIIIEALPGDAVQVVSGQVTPQQYRVYLSNSFTKEKQTLQANIEGVGDIPQKLIEEIAIIAREIEDLNHGIPQDIEWTYDGEQIWLLQTRPISTLQPIWTRKIAAEVIPGLIRPLTWSINRPLTCGVWGEIFTIVLGKKAEGLDFTETATLHYSNAYFNATLLGEIFRRMGLPPESLEFLTRGTKLSKPPLMSTLQNIPGLLRLLSRESNLEKDFEDDLKRYFAPILKDLESQSASELSVSIVLERINKILSVLEKATYYSILVPLSFALRQAILKVKDTELDNSETPEVESLRALASVAENVRNLLPEEYIASDSCCASLFADIADMPDSQSILEPFDRWLESYGYLSQVATDISVPRWKEDPRPVRELLSQFLTSKEKKSETEPKQRAQNVGWKIQLVQKRLILKAKTTKIYSQLLAHLRWSFLALEQKWLELGLLSELEDVFFLEFSEISHLIEDEDPKLKQKLPELIRQRRIQLEEDRRLTSVPYVIYGNPPASAFIAFTSPLSATQHVQGIAASPGQIQGKVKIIRNLQQIAGVDRETIVVVPYTDSGWAPMLARAGGIIAEVGGRLSHGAIVAREYGIPAVMDINNATQLLRDGQRVLLDGQRGIVEILDSPQQFDRDKV
ncbi:MAG: glycerol-3-phosphate acyltransferase [Prochloraceae cyanobacterium]|nr:glycerol-3-phosphate acyltransferase [Prochloraceae cyanobacterium]